MNYIFSKCYKLKQIKGISKFITSNAPSKEKMFLECNELNYSDPSYLDISNISNMTNTNKKVNKEKPISVIFSSIDQKIHYSIACYKSDNFSKIEKELFEEYPELKNKNINYLFNGGTINTSATLEQNKVKNSAIILINYLD